MITPGRNDIIDLNFVREEVNMAKSQEAKKETRKKPQKTLKEKKLAKLEKKRSK